MPTEDPLTVSEQRQDNVIKQMDNIKNVEEELHELLKKSTLTDEEREKITNSLENLEEAREIVNQGLTDNYSVIHDIIGQSRINLVNQMTTTGMAEQEIAAGKKDLQALMASKNKHQRMTEINTYYGQYYQAHTYTMKLIIYASLPILLFSILSSKNILPAGIAKILNIIIIVIFAILMILHISDINRRDNMVFSEYNYGTPSTDSNDINNFGSLHSSNGEVCEEDLLNDLENDSNNTEIEIETNEITNDSDSDNMEQIFLSNSKPAKKNYSQYEYCNLICDECQDRKYENCDDVYGSKCEKCKQLKQKNSSNNIIKENFQNSRIPLNVAYVASPTPSCPWGKNNSNIKPFSSNENYATV